MPREISPRSACTGLRWLIPRPAGRAGSCGWPAWPRSSASGLLGGHISFRLAGGANHAEEVPHLVEPGWHHLMAAADLPEGKPVRQMLGRGPGGGHQVRRRRCTCWPTGAVTCPGPLSDGELADGCLTCPWHGSVFRIADGSVARGPATAPQPAFEVREVGGAIQICLPGAG